MKKHCLILSGLLGLLSLTSCSNTKLEATWSDLENKKTYDDILVVGISDSEQTRRAYENYFVASFKSKGVEALESYKIISHKEDVEIDDGKSAFRNIIEKAVKDSDIDAVLMTHLVSIKEGGIYRAPIVNTPAVGPQYYSASYFSSPYGYQTYVTSYVGQPGYFTEEDTYVLETSLFDVKNEELMWTTRSKTFAPESIDQTIMDVSSLIIEDLENRNLIK